MFSLSLNTSLLPFLASCFIFNSFNLSLSLLAPSLHFINTQNSPPTLKMIKIWKPTLLSLSPFLLSNLSTFSFKTRKVWFSTHYISTSLPPLYSSNHSSLSSPRTFSWNFHIDFPTIPLLPKSIPYDSSWEGLNNTANRKWSLAPEYRDQIQAVT